MRIHLILWLLLLIWVTAQAQTLPPVSTYTPDVYGAGTQNWALTQDERGFIYAANNQGLLEYDGERWSLLPSPNGSIIRSAKAIGDRVYVGSYMDFGYYPQQGTGDSAYVSLADVVREKIQPDEQFWKIENVDGLVIFQSLSQLYLYNPATGKINNIWSEMGVIKLFATGEGVYYQDGNRALFQLNDNESARQITEMGGHPLVNLWYRGNQLVGQTEGEGIVLLSDGRWVPALTPEFLAGRQLYCSIDLRDGGKAHGSISDGVFITDADGILRYQIDHVNGLANNTILSLFEDRQGNLWAGTDNGLSVINLQSPIRKYTDVSGKIGTVHAAATFEGRLYLGTNQGLFSKVLDSQETPKLVEGTRAQVWSLYEHDGYLFCGHDRGTLVVQQGRARLIGEEIGAWCFVPVPGRDGLLLQGGYDGLSVLEWAGESWRFRNKVEGFDSSARFLVLKGRSEAYVSHEYRGVYGLKLAGDLRSVTEFKLYDQPSKSPNAGIAQLGEDTYYYSARGVYKLLDYERGFEREAELSGVLDSTIYSSGRMTATNKRLWFFNDLGLTYLYQSSLGQRAKYREVALSRTLLNMKLGYENLTTIEKDRVLIGTADGYLKLSLDEIKEPRHEIFLRSAQSLPSGSTARDLDATVPATLSHLEHNIRYELAAPNFSKFFSPRYRYRLEGADREGWSEWQTSPEFTFSEVPPGDYRFEAQSRIGEVTSDNTVSHSFSVRRPWYGSYLAWAIYVGLAVLLLVMTYRVNSRRYEKKQLALKVENDALIERQKRQSELELTRLNNERLREDVESKSREMASTMMSLVKKNELLQLIKEELQSAGEPERNISSVIHTIDENINEAETWGLFRDAFENADRDFFRKIKETHPTLTPSDLKLCAYLRLNLATKEIASMLNISPRSVEVKRYRLRKKMGLARETGLADYIISV